MAYTESTENTTEETLMLLVENGKLHFESEVDDYLLTLDTPTQFCIERAIYTMNRVDKIIFPSNQASILIINDKGVSAVGGCGKTHSGEDVYVINLFHLVKCLSIRSAIFLAAHEVRHRLQMSNPTLGLFTLDVLFRMREKIKKEGAKIDIFPLVSHMLSKKERKVLRENSSIDQDANVIGTLALNFMLCLCDQKESVQNEALLNILKLDSLVFVK